ncbi:dienelactone hydrolase family protein [Grosmannia clavigera kw1407]|uniref:Dienelactone hydrolase family protein n=1 Tax=Grosmannia clavigera (strain kw1407 / UAMH 11150) TaxID=655863 RepID=F0XQ68_GROCL|nr:dienelactone hydrolase family protein [Grosmannia clavigera kw1407]EFX00698.1 dienelactone hydrolase family protein [Grosmannia clavigera kw1407]
MASPACCQRPPVTVEYKTQGRWDEFAGLKTYIVGPENATKAVIDIYDVFGMWPQTLQGADLISALTGALVIVPDFFEGSAAGIDWIPADTPEKQKLVGEFIQTKASFDKNVPALMRVRKALSGRYPAVDDHIGVFGLCWGGKVGVLASGADNEGPGRRFNVCGTAHPGRLDIKDGESLTAPYILLASKDEPAEVVEEYRTLLSQPGKIGEVETYPDMHHGWMGARADLANASNVKEYTRGYEQIAAFFKKHL